MFETALHWLDVLNKTKDTAMLNSIIHCLGNMVNSTSKNASFGEKRKVGIISRLLYTYCSLEENSETEAFRNCMGKMMLKPSMLTDNIDSSYTHFEAAWNGFDKIPHRTNMASDYAYFARLKTKVIEPLGLNLPAF